MKLTLSQNSWPIRGSFTISRGSKTHVDTVVVQIDKDGLSGRGECVPYSRYGESIESVSAEIESVATLIEAGISRPALQELLPAAAARNAIDCALWDLECKQSDCTVWEKVGVNPGSLETAFTLSLDSPENMEAAAKQNAFRPLLKVKLGGGEDLDRLRAVRRGAPMAKIIVDANEAWTPELYKMMIPELLMLDIAMIEQPFPAGKDDVLADLPRPIPICADESCHDRKSLDRIIGRYDMINIKIDKTGGLTEALLLKKEAENRGLKIMIGCMLSSSLSMAPAFVLGQGVDIVDLDGPLLLENDIENGFDFRDNQMLPFERQLWG
ncbi:mandelate racemase [Photobacterium gaetbulicola]|uniref:Dipeptide epimerase n=1 Tax=Photobacterium gaetbulicola TaxID=1295392 RepID=A0A0B9G2Q0_9GAMM|nr:N-acetyl-D-Glu racemase DgcA [Photobacterium gaetbulicola]KHT62949.1 mandelate racemase [Photobacterium gaetbulicola]